MENSREKRDKANMQKLQDKTGINIKRWADHVK
jgi:hypothetical protein